MVSPSFKITFLGAAAIALLALSHVEAEPKIPTPAEIEKYGKDYAARALQPTKDYYKCRSDCYNEALSNILAPDNDDNISFLEKLKVAAEIAEIDACVNNEISDFKSFDKIVAYEKKRAIHELTVSQYCVDEVINKDKGVFGSGKGKLSFAQALFQALPKLAFCSAQKCSPVYLLALIDATKNK
ncbi:hypothetical protein BG003_005668 [Podila horticola]|nr:hypothetical protein BG003_005668 [Podila horticola]